jgi:N-methylhydantoinase A
MDGQILFEILRTSAGRSYHFERRFPNILARNFAPGFTVDLARKDLGLAVEMAKMHEVPVPATSLIHQLYNVSSTLGQDAGDGAGPPGRGTAPLDGPTRLPPPPRPAMLLAPPGGSAGLSGGRTGAMGRYWLGIDIGGTFTDFTLYDPDSHAVTGLKVASTPPDFARAVEDGLDRLAREHGVDLRAIDVMVHGTTIAVNTLIQRTGARLGLLVTEGFRDLLEIQRLRLPNPLDLYGGRPEPLIPRARVAEVRERLRASGAVDTPLDEAGVSEAARRLAEQGVEGFVISFLHAYRDPSHERRARALAERAAPGVPVSASHEVWPEAREYERTALTAVNAYVQPKVRRYLEGFEAALAARGVPAVPYVTKSNGGIMPVAAAQRQTVSTLLSGPASGVIGAAYVATAAGLGNLITLDVGGTSADIAVVEEGRPRYSTTEQIGGIPVMMPVVGVTAIGAGGGSVAWVDEVGVPKVGPQSTGANPGPACYGRGGKEATLSDAFLVSGFLDPDRFLGGRMRLDRALAEEAVGRFADRLGMSLHEAAESVVRVAVSNMYAAFTKILSRAGVDPREFALVAFGGAGPLVGSLLAREVGIPAVFVPRAPGTLCALGAITTDVLNDAVRTVHGRLDALDLAALAGEQRGLEAELLAWVSEHAVDVERTTFRHGADMRYVGQSYEIEVGVEPEWLATGVRARLLEAFHRAHERVFGHADPHAPVEVVNLRAQLRGVRPRVPLVEVPAGTGARPTSTRRIWLEGRPAQAQVYERASLGRGDRVVGPAIVEQPDTTVLVPSGDAATVDRFGNLLVRREA